MFTIPEEVRSVTETLENAGFEAYLVGGCVRDMVLKREPKDWDVTTNATPEQIQALFENTFYENSFGTVGVVNEKTEDERVKVVEVTPYRVEGVYSDARRPDIVSFSKKLEDDLKRRDFTINAMSFSVSKGHLEDPYKGQIDLNHKSIAAVGEPGERFAEDALRMLRAIRLAAELSFTIAPETAEAIAQNAPLLEKISRERVRDELIRIVLSEQPMVGIILAHQLTLLPHIIPELEAGIGVKQNQAHKYEVFEHNLRTLQHAADKKLSLEVRLAALFHDISKPISRRWSQEKKDWTFHGHEVVGARATKKVLSRLRFPKEIIEKVTALVRWHMFFSDPEEVTLAAVRRTIRNVGEDNINDLLDLRMCDRIGTGRPKEQPFRFRKYKSMVDEARRDPISVSMLKLDGNALMKHANMKPGPRIGWILHALLEDVLDDPKRNNESELETRARELSKLSDETLRKLGEAGREKRDRYEAHAVKTIRHKHFVE